MSTVKVNAIRSTSGTSDAITLNSSSGVTAINGNGLRAQNLVINGAMQVAQRGTSSTSEGYATVDRHRIGYGGEDEDPTQAQITLTSSDTGPWAKGFTKALQITNGNQTSGAGAADSCTIQYKMEGQDLANSGWEFTNPNSKITISFWAKSSVAQTFYGRFRLYASSQYEYTYSIALSADTWTKVTKTLPGNSNFSSLVNTDALGLLHSIQLFYGTDYTDDKTLDTWAVKVSGNASPDMTSTWWTTNDATFALTGVQLEVGPTASEYMHETYGETLAKCQRYYQDSSFGKVGGEAGAGGLFMCHPSATDAAFGSAEFAVSMRTRPTIVLYDYATSPASAAVTQMANANGLAATAANITYTNFSRIDKGSGNFNNTTNQGILAGFTATAEL